MAYMYMSSTASDFGGRAQSVSPASPQGGPAGERLVRTSGGRGEHLGAREGKGGALSAAAVMPPVPACARRCASSAARTGSERQRCAPSWAVWRRGPPHAHGPGPPRTRRAHADGAAARTQNTQPEGALQTRYAPRRGRAEAGGTGTLQPSETWCGAGAQLTEGERARRRGRAAEGEQQDMARLRVDAVDTEGG